MSGKGRQLDRHDVLCVMLFRMLTTETITDKAYDHVTSVLAYLGYTNLSKDVVVRRAVKLSGLVVKKLECCPNFCISYGDKQYSSTDQCPICSAARYRIVKRRKRYTEGIVEVKKPAAFFEYYPVSPYMDAMLSNPQYCQYIQESFESTRRSQAHPAEGISDISQSLILRHLRTDLLPGIYDIPLSFSSDAAEIQTKRNQGENVSAHISTLSVLSLPNSVRFKHASSWRCMVMKKPADIKSFLKVIEQEALHLESGQARWIAAEGRLIWQKTAIINSAGDTVEQAALAGATGATGMKSCFECENVGCLSNGRYYCPFHMPFGSGRIDVALPGRRNANSQTYPTRSIEGLDDALGKLRNAGNPSRRAAIQRDTGVSSRPLFYYTRAFKTIYPFFFARDTMHALYSVLFADTLAFLAGKKPSLLAERFLAQGFWEGVQAFQKRNKYLKPYAMGTAPRSVLKLADWKAAERRTFITQDFIVYSDLLQYDEDPVIRQQYELIKAMVIVARLLESPSTLDSPQVFPADSTSVAESGRFECTKGSLEHYLGGFLTIREIVLYGRNRTFLPKICTPTHHRVSHMANDRVNWGEGTGYAQWQLEGIIGDETRRARSQRHTIKNMANNARKKNALSLLHLKFDNIPSIHGDSTLPTATSPALPGTTLLHPSRKAVPFPPDFHGLLISYLDHHEVSRDACLNINKWGRCRILTDVIIRSKWIEGDMDEDNDRYASRFVKITADPTEIIAEVLSFWEIKLARLQHQRLLMLVKTYESQAHPTKMFDTALASGHRRVLLLGVEAIRQLVDVKAMPVRPGQPAALAFSTKASQNATARVESPPLI